MNEVISIPSFALVLLSIVGLSQCPVGPAVEVPNVEGLGVGHAEIALADVGLELGGITQTYDEVRPQGEVISQSPEAGETIPIGHAVSLVISAGPAPVSDVWYVDASTAASPARQGGWPRQLVVWVLQAQEASLDSLHTQNSNKPN